MARKREEVQVFSVSFLDVISCALGGVLLLLLLNMNKSAEQAAVHQRQAAQLADQIKAGQIKLASVSSALKGAKDRAEAAARKATVAQQRAEAAERQAGSARIKSEEAQREASKLGQAIKDLEKAQKALLGFKGDLENVVFVFDTSGSMDFNGRFDEYCEYLNSLVQNVAFESFNVIRFSDDAQPLERRQLLGRSLSSLSRGEKYIGTFSAGGGTSTDAALQLALRMPNVDTIILFSDGAPSDALPQAIIRKFISASGGKVVVNTVAMGDYLATGTSQKPFIKFLQDLAIKTGGQAILHN